MTTFTAEDAQERLEDLIELAHQGRKVFIERDGAIFELIPRRDDDEIDAGRNRNLSLMRAGEERANRKTE